MSLWSALNPLSSLGGGGNDYKQSSSNSSTSTNAAQNSATTQNGDALITSGAITKNVQQTTQNITNNVMSDNGALAAASQAVGGALLAVSGANANMLSAATNAMAANQQVVNSAFAFSTAEGTRYADNEAQLIGVTKSVFDHALENDHELVGTVTGQIQQAYSAGAAAQTNNQIADYRLLIFGLIALGGLYALTKAGK